MNFSMCFLHRWQWTGRRHVWHRGRSSRFGVRQRRWRRQPRRWRWWRHYQHVPLALTHPIPPKQQPPSLTPPHLLHPPSPPPSQQQQQQQQWAGLHHTQGGLALRGARLHSRRHSHSQQPGAAGVICARRRPRGLGQNPHRCGREVRSPQHAAPWEQRQLLWVGGRNQSDCFVILLKPKKKKENLSKSDKGGRIKSLLFLHAPGHSS